MLRPILIVTTFAFVAFSCGRPASPPKPSAARQATRSGAQALKGKKPESAMKTTQPPRPMPSAKSAGSTTVTPKDITQGGTVTVETWSFSDVDLDGDGQNENGVAAVAGEELAAWWTGSFFLEETKETVPYEAMLWTEGGGVGFIFDFGKAALACAVANDAAACVTCDANGECSVSE